MKIIQALCFVSLLIVALSSTVIAADTLELKDGTILKGTLVSRDANSIKFQTQYSTGEYPVSAVKNLSIGGFGQSSAPQKQPSHSARPEPAVTAQKNELLAGTVMSVKLTQPLSSQVKKGSRVGGELTAPLAAGSKVIPAGSRVYGVVTSSSTGGTPHIAVAMNQLLVMGKPVDIHTQEVRFSGSGQLGIGQATARGATVGAIIGGNRRGARKGAKIGAGAAVLSGPKTTQVPAGTVFDSTVLRDAVIP